MPSLQIKRGTKAQIDAAATAGTLKAGEVYFVTDTGKLAVGTGTSAYNSFVIDNYQVTEVTTDQAYASGTLTNITALVGSVVANGIYSIDAFITYQSTVSTQGVIIGALLPSGSRNMIEIRTQKEDNASGDGRLSSKIFPIASSSNDTIVQASDVGVINYNYTSRINGIIKVGGTAGACQLRFAAESTSATATIKAGSMMVLKRIA